MRTVFKTAFIAVITLIGVNGTSKENCVDPRWRKLYDFPELERHFAILTDIRKEQENTFEMEPFYTGTLRIFNFTFPERVVETIVPGLEFLEGKQGHEEIVVTLTINTERGVEVHQELFWDFETQTEAFEMPDRKKMPDDFVIASNFKVGVVDAPSYRALPKVLTGFAFSKENGLIRGLSFNPEWEAEVTTLRTGFDVHLFEEMNKHVPQVEISSEFKYTLGDLTTRVKDEDEKGLVTVKLAHAAKTGDVHHFVGAVWLEDEFGRVVAFKKVDFASYEEGKSVQEELELFTFAKGYKRVTPYEFCSLHGIFQGPSIFIPYEGELPKNGEDTCEAA